MVRRSTARERDCDPAALFVFVGAHPRPTWSSGLLELDENGYVFTGLDLPRENAVLAAGRWIATRSFRDERPGYLRRR